VKVKTAEVNAKKEQIKWRAKAKVKAKVTAEIKAKKRQIK
jgi:hypothetical protein